MERVYNFSAGPSQLPVEVLHKAQLGLLSYQGTGMSVMEMSHRSSNFIEILDKAEALLRKLMNIPDEYHVLFIQGGASLQFSMVPMNLLVRDGHAYYVDTGSWSQKAIKEAKKIGDARILASSQDQQYTYIPHIDKSLLEAKTNYLHITTNNTIEGTRHFQIPDIDSVPIVADMSSNILSEPLDSKKFGLIYAGTQKNLGIAGLTLVIIHKALITSKPQLPTMLSYETYTKHHSLYNTPPTFSIYMMMLVLEWIQNQGGISFIHQQSLAKAKILYDYLDQSHLFHSYVKTQVRSLTNIPFFTHSPEIDLQFLKQAEKRSLHQLKGHRSVGGMRASIYNGMPIEGVQKLVDFMKEFESHYV